MIQKGLCNTAVLSYRPLLEDVAQRLVATVAGFQGHPEEIVNEQVYYDCIAISNHKLAFLSLNPSFSRALSGLFIKTAYADALSQRAIDELVVASKQAQRRTSEASTHLWLVNFIPCSESLELSQLPEDNSK